MMYVNEEKCIGCGLCVSDCTVRDIRLTGDKAEMQNKRCFKCGHCIAICPTGAVSTDEYSMDDVEEYNEKDFSIDADNLLNFIKFRRSVRAFKEQDVEDEKILKIIEAGRFTQTSTNNQDVSYIVIREGIDELKGMALKRLDVMGRDILDNLTEENKAFAGYAKMWVRMYENYKEDPSGAERLFYNAPVLILVISKTPINGGLASSNMELMTNALGLGTFFSGFLVRAAQGNKEIMDYLNIEEGKEIVSALVIGYPDIKYSRTAPRKEADITWR